MEIDFIIPAKTSSTRMPHKNWRSFGKHGQSLVSLQVDKLKAAGADPARIFVSCEAETLRETVEDMGVQFMLRDPALCGNNVRLTDWIREIVKQSEASGDVAWCQVCDPLFTEYDRCLREWQTARKYYDSLVVCHPYRGYLMTEQSQPIGWSFGVHHTPSQHLPKFRTMPFTFSILSQQAIAATGYHVGARPIWIEATTGGIDIDTRQDFYVAEFLWQRANE